MEELAIYWPKESKAFQLFLIELDDIIVQTEKFCKSFDEDMSEEQIYEIQNCYHKVKGAAGMFCMCQLAVLAAKLEKAFKQAHYSEVTTIFPEFKKYCLTLANLKTNCS